MISNLTKEKKQIIYLYASTLIGVLLGVLSSIINTRFLAPTDYGDVRYVQNIINFVASLLLFGYFVSGSRLLALSKDEAYSKTIRGAMVIILLICSCVLVLTCLVCYGIHINKPVIASLFLVSIPVCSQPLLINYINTTAQGDNHIGLLSLARLMPALIYIPVAFLIYKEIGATSTVMILLQWGIAVVIYSIIIVSSKLSFQNLKPAFQDLSKENKDYGFQLYIGSLVMVATNYIAGVTIGIFNSDNSEVAFYTLALTVTAPLAMLPSIVGTTYFKAFASQPRIPSKIMKFSILLTAVSCILFIAIIKPLVVFLYTEDYSRVGVYAIILAIGSSIHGLGDMINRYLGSHGQGLAIRNSSIANGCFKVIGYTLFVYWWGTIGALVTTIVCDIIYASVLYIYYYRFINKEIL